LPLSPSPLPRLSCIVATAAIIVVTLSVAIATNIIIEHNGANVGMITTKGYRDIIHIARHKKPMNFSLWQNLPWQAFPIARRRNRLGCGRLRCARAWARCATN
jgi:N-methylhydantoinase A/oxoprolinase/acetone carboxylase beta subunit